MKRIALYIHTISSEVKQQDMLWLKEFAQRLAKSLENFNVYIGSISYTKKEFLDALNSGDIGCYLPIIDRYFSHSQTDKIIFSEIKEFINSNNKTRAFTLSLIQEVVPINYAVYQPFYNFYNQAFYPEEQKRYGSINLPGNNTEQSFQYHINNIAKEINYQLIRITVSGNFEKGIYISSTTSDLEEPVNSLYNFIMNHNLDVLSPIQPEGLSLDYAKKKIQQNLQRSWLSVHPIGNGSLKEGNYLKSNQTFCELENELSAQYYKQLKANRISEKYFKRIIWLPKPTTPGTFEGRMIERVKNSSFENADILNCSFDELKEIILSYYEDYQEKTNISNQNITVKDDDYSSSRKKELISDYSNSVFILFENNYETDSKVLRNLLNQKNQTSVMLQDIDDSLNFTQTKSQILQKCKGIIIFSSSWNNAWFKSNMNDIIKTKIMDNSQFNYIYLYSREIEQLPQDIENDVILVKISGVINNENIPDLLFN